MVPKINTMCKYENICPNTVMIIMAIYTFFSVLSDFLQISFQFQNHNDDATLLYIRLIFTPIYLASLTQTLGMHVMDPPP